MMEALDELTVDRVARLVCDIDGPYERTGSQIERFLHRVRWPDGPQYDGSSRVHWLGDIIREHLNDAAAVDRLLCRICDPVEYDNGLETAKPVADELNRILEPEGLVVSYVGGRPVLGQQVQPGHAPSFGQPADLRGRIERLTQDGNAVDVLLARADEATICQDSGACTLAIIGIGSFVEGLLHVVITEHDQDVRANGLTLHNGRKVAADRAGLLMLLEYAHRRKWIQTDAKDFMEKVKDYRNFVHPRHQIEYGFVPDIDTVKLCWAPVHAVLNDLESVLLSP
jgi:hypothetical protein